MPRAPPNQDSSLRTIAIWGTPHLRSIPKRFIGRKIPIFAPGSKVFLSSRYECLAKLSLSIFAVDEFSSSPNYDLNPRMVLRLREAKERRLSRCLPMLDQPPSRPIPSPHEK